MGAQNRKTVNCNLDLLEKVNVSPPQKNYTSLSPFSFCYRPGNPAFSEPVGVVSVAVYATGCRSAGRSCCLRA